MKECTFDENANKKILDLPRLQGNFGKQAGTEVI